MRPGIFQPESLSLMKLIADIAEKQPVQDIVSSAKNLICERPRFTESISGVGYPTVWKSENMRRNTFTAIF